MNSLINLFKILIFFSSSLFEPPIALIDNEKISRLNNDIFQPSLSSKEFSIIDLTVCTLNEK
jgi:hypothetical protein